MKPEGAIARKGDYAVVPCPHAVAAGVIRKHHYARGCSHTSVHSHCLVRLLDGVVVGGALWMPPTRPAAVSVAGEHWRGVLCLSRLAVGDDEPANATSLFLAASMRLVAKDHRWHLLLTYADTRQGHTGAIYRATNWEYVGLMPGSRASVWIDPRDGRQVTQKSTRMRTPMEMRDAGYISLPSSQKHKFVYRIRRPEGETT